MNSRRIEQVLLLGAALAIGASARAESAPGDVVDMKAGAFEPPPPSSTSAATAETQSHGVIAVSISAVNKSKIPTNANVSCSVFWRATASDNSVSLSGFYATRALITASRISCAANVPYVVPVSLARITFFVFPEIALISGNGAATPGSANPTTTSIQLPSVAFPLPPSGSTVTRTFSDVM